MARHYTADTKIIGPRSDQFKSQDTDPTAMSLQDQRFAPDGDAYIYANKQMWEGAAATEHSHNHSPQSSDVVPERRIAADNTPTTHTRQPQIWKTAAATEHSHSRSSQSSDVLPQRCRMSETVVLPIGMSSGSDSEHLEKAGRAKVVADTCAAATTLAAAALASNFVGANADVTGTFDPAQQCATQVSSAVMICESYEASLPTFNLTVGLAMLVAVFCCGVYVGKHFAKQRRATQSVGTQSQTTYTRWTGQPRFHVLPESSQG